MTGRGQGEEGEYTHTGRGQGTGGGIYTYRQRTGDRRENISIQAGDRRGEGSRSTHLLNRGHEGTSSTQRQVFITIIILYCMESHGIDNTGRYSYNSTCTTLPSGPFIIKSLYEHR